MKITPPTIPVPVPWSPVQWQSSTLKQLGDGGRLPRFLCEWEAAIPDERGSKYINNALVAALLAEKNPAKIEQHPERAAAVAAAKHIPLSSEGLLSMLAITSEHMTHKSDLLSSIERVEMAMTIASFCDYASKQLVKPTKSQKKAIAGLISHLRQSLVGFSIPALNEHFGMAA